MRKKYLLLFFSLALTSCGGQNKNDGHWIQQNEEGPSDNHSYLVVKNQQSNVYIGILRKHDELASLIVNSGLSNPSTTVGIGYADNKELRQIKITERVKIDGNSHKESIIIEKIDGKWILKEASD